MAIYKAKVNTNFVVIPNTTAQDVKLSLEARGLLTFMLSLPESWVIHKSWLVNQFEKCGRDKLNRIMTELKDAGYLRKKLLHKESGVISGTDWEVYPITALLKNRTTAKPYDGKPAPIKETSLEKKHNNSLSESSDAGEVIKYLNKQSGSKYKSSTKSHIENINARLKDGHSVDELKMVIDCKLSEWKDDPRMANYLRPSTLFQPSKFEGYLMSAKAQQPVRPVVSVDKIDELSLMMGDF